jgi:hypothetical protein
MLLVDTDVLIWYLRGNAKAFKTIENFASFSLSVVTYMELVRGMRSKNELNSPRQALHAWNASIIHITEEISAKAMFAVEQHFLSHSLQLADALIGSTAVAHSLPLLTGNDKYYKIMKDVQIKKFRP